MIPPVAIAEAGITAVSELVDTKVVAIAIPLNRMCDVRTKSAPWTASVNALPPAVRFLGDIDRSSGRGLMTVKTWGALGPITGDGFQTTTSNRPPVTKQGRRNDRRELGR